MKLTHYVCFVGLDEFMNERLISVTDLSRLASVAPTTVIKAIKGQPVLKATSKSICKGLDITPQEAVKSGLIIHQPI
jgi:DNA-binding Xre family transcriptional regulator